MLKCVQRTAGGKGNEGMFIERGPKILAAGVPTAQAKETVAKTFNQRSLQDEVDALIADSIIPAPKEYFTSKPATRLNMRNAGMYCETRSLINPPLHSKFETLVEDFKSTVYISYWNKVLGRARDRVPLLPEGHNVVTKVMGSKPVFGESLYDVVMPKYPVVTDESQSKRVGYQIDRNYCRPAYNPNNNFGIKYKSDKRGTFAKCCMSDENVILGITQARVSAIKADTTLRNTAQLSLPKSPNDNISCVPEGFAFGILKPPDNLPECLTRCEFNTGRQFFFKCLGHLNTLRKCLSKRFESGFFQNFYLQLKFLDKAKSGWLPKEVVYNACTTRYIRFDPSLIEPLLETWNAFNGTQIEYKIFILVINYREPSPTLPKIKDIPDECLEISTTYGDMVKPGQKANKSLRAGLPSGRYLDKDYPVTPANCCKADTVYLPEESDAFICLNPSTLTLLGVSHRDMYAKRSPEEVRKVFKSIEEPRNDEDFNKIWDEAKKYHSQGWVCYETFRKALREHRD